MQTLITTLTPTKSIRMIKSTHLLYSITSYNYLGKNENDEQTTSQIVGGKNATIKQQGNRLFSL